MGLKARYFWEKAMYYISGNLGIGFSEYEKRAKTSRLMICTNLVDCRGKEIYEGDIIIGDFYNIPAAIINLRTYYYHTLEYCSPENTEVIGNIYENPELFKEEI